VGPLLTQ